MYTNATASNLNFNLYRGGKHFRKTRKNKRNQRKQYRGGESFFRPKTPETVSYATKKCNTDCESNARRLCDATCKSATAAALDVKNTGITREFIEELTSRSKKNEEKYLVLLKEHETLKQKYEMLESVTKR